MINWYCSSELLPGHGGCWLCSVSASVVMRRVYGALFVAMLVVCRVCAESGRVTAMAGWLHGVCKCKCKCK